MAQNQFYTQTKCDRCGKFLAVRTMSWFTTQTICMACCSIEQNLKKEMRKKGMNPDDYEGCGYIPKV